MKKISLVEYGVPKRVISNVAEELNVSPLEVTKLIANAGERVKNELGLSDNPISLNGDNVRAVDFAGIIKADSSLIIEVAPKFLGLDSDNSHWREDFFYLATLSKNGILLNTDRITSSPGERGDLYTLIARAYIDMFWKNHRRPIRVYKKQQFVDFSIDGEVDPEFLYLPTNEGFEQSVITLERKNKYNAVILAAAQQLLPNLREPNIIAQMYRVIQTLSPQPNIAYVGNLIKERLPNRSASWQSLYNLSIDIIRGLGLMYRKGNMSAPGYVLKTWKVWEDLLSIAIKRGFGTVNIFQQTDFILGNRHRINKEPAPVNVTPDLVVTVSSDDSSQRFVFDAKYKGHVERGVKQISSQDLYESLAFARATGCNKVILAYPGFASENLKLGETKIFERIEVDNIVVTGIDIGIKGISSKNGIVHFSKDLADNCLEIIKQVGRV